MAGDWYETYWENNVSDNVRDDIYERTGYGDHEMFTQHFDIAADMFGDNWSGGEEHQFWADYLDAFVDGHLSRDEFFEMYDMDPDDFDWAAWREAMGY